MKIFLESLTGTVHGWVVGKREGRCLVKIAELKSILPVPVSIIPKEMTIALNTAVLIEFKEGEMVQVTYPRSAESDNVKIDLVPVLEEPETKKGRLRRLWERFFK